MLKPDPFMLFVNHKSERDPISLLERFNDLRDES